MYVSATYNNADSCMLTSYDATITCIGNTSDIEPWFGFYATRTGTGTFTAYAVCVKSNSNTSLNSDLKSRLDRQSLYSGSITAYADTCPIGLTVVVTGNDTTQMAGMTSRYTIGFVLNRASDSGVVILFPTATTRFI